MTTKVLFTKTSLSACPHLKNLSLEKDELVSSREATISNTGVLAVALKITAKRHLLPSALPSEHS
jgi:hypothetical protein